MGYRLNSQQEKIYAEGKDGYETTVTFNYCNDVGWTVIVPNCGGKQEPVVGITLKRLGQIYRDAVKASKKKAKVTK